METLILYLDTENDNRKRIRTLNITQVEFEMIKSLELSYGNKGNILKIVYSDKVLLLINKELELIYRQMQYPKYFINIERKWQSPLYLNTSVINYTDVMENICGLYYLNSINGIDGKNIPFSMLANDFELLFNFKFADIYKKRDEVLKESYPPFLALIYRYLFLWVLSCQFICWIASLCRNATLLFQVVDEKEFSVQLLV